MERTRRKSSSPDTIKGISSAGFFFASKHNEKSTRPRISCDRRSANKATATIQQKVAQSVIQIRRDLKRRIANAGQLPIPRFARHVMPLELERRGQSVDAFIQQLHHAIVAAVDRDFADPDRAWAFNLHKGVGRRDSGPAHPTKTFPHAFEKPRSIVVPLIAIIVADKIGHSLPVSVIDRVKEILRMQEDLMLGSPKPEEI